MPATAAARGVLRALLVASEPWPPGPSVMGVHFHARALSVEMVPTNAPGRGFEHRLRPGANVATTIDAAAEPPGASPRSAPRIPLPQLADVEMAVHRIRGRVASPAEEDVAIGLHQVPPGDDTLVLIGVLAVPAVADHEVRLGPRDPAAPPSGPRPDPSEKPTYQTFRPRHQSSLLWPLLPVQPGDAAELYALQIAPLVLIPVKRAARPPASPTGGENRHGEPAGPQPSTDGPFDTTGHHVGSAGPGRRPASTRDRPRRSRARRARSRRAGRSVPGDLRRTRPPRPILTAEPNLRRTQQDPACQRSNRLGNNHGA